jgi:hypothetical protein
VRTSSDDVAVWQEAPVLVRVELVENPLLDEPIRLKLPEEVLGESVVLR